MKRTMKRAGRIFGLAIAAVVALVVLFIAVMNVAKFAIYPDYYECRSNICINPGLGDGFVCQGICEAEEAGVILISGYMKDGSASRIYMTDTQNRSRYVSLSLDGAEFDRHAGGIATHGDEVYVVCSHAVHILSLQTLLQAENGAVVEIAQVVRINNTGSSAYCDGTYLYIGEFHDGGKYITDHPYDTPDGRYHAIISRYRLDDLTAPDKVYAIRNKVQGTCFTPDGKVVLSTSFGLAPSVYYLYDEAKAIDSGLTLDGAPVFFLCDVERTIKGPPMAEGLEYYHGTVMTLTESASDKYIFGKFFFANKIVALDILG